MPYQSAELVAHVVCGTFADAPSLIRNEPSFFPFTCEKRHLAYAPDVCIDDAGFEVDDRVLKASFAQLLVVTAKEISAFAVKPATMAGEQAKRYFPTRLVS